MKRKRLGPRSAKFLTRERVIRVATVGRDGTPHVVPVCHAVEGGMIYFGSDQEGRKIRNLGTRGKISLVADRYSDNWGRLRGVSVSGRAEVFRGGPVFERGRQLLYRKFRQYERVAALDPGDSVIVRVTPTRVMHWNYAE